MSEFGSVRKGCDMKKASVLRWLLSLNVLVRFKLITRPGLEPGKSEPKSDVLPLHHRVAEITQRDSRGAVLSEQVDSVDTAVADRFSEIPSKESRSPAF